MASTRTLRSTSASPASGTILGARVLAEFGDAPGRYTDAKARKNYAGTSPITRQSGKTKTVHARFIHNDRLVNALDMQASAAILHDPASAPTTTNSAAATSATTPPYAKSATASSASSTAAWRGTTSCR